MNEKLIQQAVEKTLNYAKEHPDEPEYVMAEYSNCLEFINPLINKVLEENQTTTTKNKENELWDLKIQTQRKTLEVLELAEKWFQFNIERDRRAEERMNKQWETMPVLSPDAKREVKNDGVHNL